LVTPSSWALETRNALLALERRGLTTIAGTDSAITSLDGLPLHIMLSFDATRLSQIVALGRRHRLSAYDAAYLDAAIMLAATLATRDRALSVAARSEQVTVVGIDAS
jgi:predicted nucleic acid-binding protein